MKNNLTPEAKQKILDYINSGHCPRHMLPIYRWWLQRRPEQTCPDPVPTVLFLLGGRGSGKRLDIETLIPTPIGYKKLGDIEIGDTLFDEQGQQCKVTALFDGISEKAYELKFIDGSTIIADAEHLWETSTQLERRYPKKHGSSFIRETQEIVSTLQKNGTSNHSVCLTKPLQIVETRLPLDSWLLGFWLGDGSTGFGTITISDEDFYILNKYELGRSSRRPGARCQTINVVGLTNKLNTIGVLWNKYVPEEYMWSSEDQRLSLLQGLMDSDGHAVLSRNTVEFCSTKEVLARQVQQLARSLGEKPTLIIGRAKLNGKDCGPKYRVFWRPSIHNPFTLKRKADRLNMVDIPNQSRHRMIVESKEVSPRLMRCLTVDSPSHLFLAGEQMVPTHNTYAAANHIYEYSVKLPHVPENKIVYVALIGSTFEDVKNVMIEGVSGLLNVIPEENLIAWNRTVGELKYFVIEDGQYREIRCNSYTAERPEKLRGPNTHVAWLDEYAKFRDSDVDPDTAGTTFNNMMMGLRLGTKPHVLVTGTPTPCKLTRYLLNYPDMQLSKMTTIDNKDNLPDSYMVAFNRLRKDSRTYRQEVMAEVLTDNPNAIFNEEDIELNRADLPNTEELDPTTLEYPKILKVLAYDPSASSAAGSDECGIIICGYTPEVKQATKLTGGRPIVVKPAHAYVLEDLSGHYTTNEQVQKVIQKILSDRIEDLVFEQNQGVEFVMGALEQAIKDNTIEYKVRKHQKSKKTDYGVVKRWFVSGVTLENEPFKFTIYAIHAVKGKTLRAEMVSTRYETNQVHHPHYDLPVCELSGCGASLEAQMVAWDPKNTRMSPDRLDALVYCLLHIFSGFMLTRSKVTISRPPAAVTQMGSQHGAVRKGRAVAGIYSMDLGGSPGDTADRSLIPHLEQLDGRRIENPYYK